MSKRKMWYVMMALVLVGNGLVVLRAETRELRESFARESRTFLRLAAPQALRAYGESGQPDKADDQISAVFSANGKTHGQATRYRTTRFAVISSAAASRHKASYLRRNDSSSSRDLGQSPLSRRESARSARSLPPV